MKNIEAEIQRAWLLRNKRKLDEVETLVELIEKQLNTSASNEPFRWELELLKASVLRANGKRSRAIQLIDRLEAEISTQKIKPPFNLYFQKALNHFAVNDFAVALEFFLQAHSAASNSSERLNALVNYITCLEGLNMPWAGALAEAERLSKGVSPEELLPVRDHLEAFQKRKLFRTGQLREFFLSSIDETRAFNLSEYYSMWVSALPYVELANENYDNSLERLLRARDFYAGKYRLHTLVGDPRLDQKIDRDHPIEPSMKVDRIYLWTWRWLVSPTESNRKNLACGLSEFDFAESVKKMTFEDFQMMHNALSWIAVTQPNLQTSIDSYLKKFSIGECQWFPIFEYERLCISFVEQRLKRKLVDDVKLWSAQHPLLKNKDLGIYSFASKLASTLETKITKRFAVVVDETTHSIVTKKEVIVSKPIASLLTELVEKKVLDFNDALLVAFEIPDYDEEIHAVKIYNLINRIKKLLPLNVEIKTKEMKIYLSAPSGVISAPKVHPLQKKIFTTSFDFTGKSLEKRSFANPLHPRVVVEQAGGKKVWKRSELQSLMNISKASTARWIERWEKQGLIKPSGSGPSTSYFIDIIDKNRLTPIV